jgi:hypothetical protein
MWSSILAYPMDQMIWNWLVKGTPAQYILGHLDNHIQKNPSCLLIEHASVPSRISSTSRKEKELVRIDSYMIPEV